MATKKPLYLIDASIYIFRAWFSLPETLTDPDDNPVNAVYGFTMFLHQLISESLNKSQGSHYAVAFDESLTASFRNKIYPDYKANREPAPDDLKWQFKQCQAMAKTLGLATFSSKRYEADDILGTIANKMRNKGFNMVIVSSDKDLSQIMRSGDLFWDYARQRKLSAKTAADHFGVKPSLMVDLLALMGDSIDNIPGVPGIGKKTATQLLTQFKNLDHVYANLDNVSNMSLRGSKRIASLLKKHKESAYLSQRLARIIDDAPIKCSSSQLSKKKIKQRSLIGLCNKLGFGERLRARLLELD